MQVADAGSLPLALGGGAAVAALSVALIATDPDKRYGQAACHAHVHMATEATCTCRVLSRPPARETS